MYIEVLKSGESMKQVYLPDAMFENNPKWSWEKNYETREALVKMHAFYLKNIAANFCDESQLEIWLTVGSKMNGRDFALPEAEETHQYVL